MKKTLTSMIPAAVIAAGFVNVASAELVTEVIHTVDSTHYHLFEEVDGYKGTVAWRAPVDDTSYYYYRVHYWDGTSVRLINPEGERAVSPSLYDGKIAYVSQNTYGTSNHSLMYWDSTYNNGSPHIVEITSGNRITEPSLHDGRIAWTAYDGNDWEAYYWDGTYSNGQPNITQVTDNETSAGHVELDGNRVVWVGWNTGVATLNYWEGGQIETLDMDPAIVPEAGFRPSADDGGIAWTGVDGNIHYWDGTFAGGNPNIVMAVSRVNGNGSGYLGGPSLHEGRISYYRSEPWRPYGQEEAIYYWDGRNTAQLSEWYQISGSFTPSTASSGVFYVGRSATTSQHEIRHVTSTGICL